MIWKVHVPEALRSMDRMLIADLEPAHERGLKIQKQAYRGRIIASNSVASRELLTSVGTREVLRTQSIIIKEVFSDKIQALIMEGGRKPNKPRPPIRAILEWMPYRNLGRDLGRAFAIAITIGRKGIKARWLAKKAFEDSKPAVIAEIEAAVSNFVKRFR